MQKSFMKSKTIWGALVAFLAVFLPALGLDFGPDVVGEVKDIGDQAISLSQAAAGLVGTGLVIWGRMTAVAKVIFKSGSGPDVAPLMLFILATGLAGCAADGSIDPERARLVGCATASHGLLVAKAKGDESRAAHYQAHLDLRCPEYRTPDEKTAETG